MKAVFVKRQKLFTFFFKTLFVLQDFYIHSFQLQYQATSAKPEEAQIQACYKSTPPHHSKFSTTFSDSPRVFKQSRGEQKFSHYLLAGK